MEIQIKKLHENAKLPSYAHEGDAGMDFFALTATTINPNQRVLIETGIAMVIPKNHVGLIWDKSGLAARNGLTTFGGVIDCGYRGEIKIVVYNSGSETYQVEAGQKIAQMLIQKIESPKLKQVTQFQEHDQNTSRAEGGFGSTGLK